MDIWISWCHRRTKCDWCEESITMGNPVARGKWWKKGQWSKRYYWHPECWVKQGLAALDKSPFDNRHKVRSVLSPEQSKRRSLLLREWADKKHRLLRAAEVGSNKAIESLINRMCIIYADMLSVGGVPKSWTDPTELKEFIDGYEHTGDGYSVETTAGQGVVPVDTGASQEN